jgi:hypothetical protein
MPKNKHKGIVVNEKRNSIQRVKLLNKVKNYLDLPFSEEEIIKELDINKDIFKRMKSELGENDEKENIS